MTKEAEALAFIAEHGETVYAALSTHVRAAQDLRASTATMPAAYRAVSEDIASGIAAMVAMERLQREMEQ